MDETLNFQNKKVQPISIHSLLIKSGYISPTSINMHTYFKDDLYKNASSIQFQIWPICKIRSTMIDFHPEVLQWLFGTVKQRNIDMFIYVRLLYLVVKTSNQTFASRSLIRFMFVLTRHFRSIKIRYTFKRYIIPYLI